jgi:DNA-binding PadR family transcriptional regulator
MDVRTICLGLLSMGEATGYDIKKMFEDGSLGSIVEVSFGSIYPALTRLSEEGLISCREESQDRRPDRKIYSITEKGQRVFATALLEPVGEDRFRSPFLFAMVFAHLMPRARVSALIDAQLAQYERKRALLVEKQKEIDTPGNYFTCSLGLASYETLIKFVRDNRHIVENAALPNLGAAETAERSRVAIAATGNGA